MTDKEKLEKLKKLADAMYYATQYLTTDASSLHKAMDEYHQFIVNEYHKEEPVNEDLEESIDTYIATYFGSEQEKQNWPFLKKMAIHFANWQKEKMLAKAVDAVVKIDTGGYPYVDRTIELYDYDKDIPLAKEGDKYKVILIKED